MTIEVVVGINWGDEGKGRIVDYLAQEADVVCRYQGGNNAGHTVINEFGEFKLHLIPSGVFNPAVTNVLGPGMVIDLEALVGELSDLRKNDIPADNIIVSDRASICLPIHRLEDAWEEERLGAKAFGSTKRGIAPAYSDRYLKKALQVGELLHPSWMEKHLRDLITWKNLVAKGVYGKDNAFSFEETLQWLVKFGDQIKPLIKDTADFMDGVARQGKRILFEAQLGAMRDIYFGIYPYTTSSCSLASFATTGGALFGHTPDRVLGVMKAFSTCVGEGPFVTELHGEEAHNLREIAKEYGAATGRPRRIGHFDAVASREGAFMQGATEIAVTKLDCLSGIDPLRICTHYDVKGELIRRFPLNPVLEQVQPVYKELPGWTGDITQVQQFGDLPANAQEYVLEMERLVERPVRYVSVGPERPCLIDRGAC